MVDSQGQTFTLEAAMTVLLMLIVLIFLIEAIPLTPLTSSAANAAMENALEVYAGDVLNVLTYEPQYDLDNVGITYNTSILKEALIYWGVRGDSPPTIYGGASSRFYNTSFSRSANGVILLKDILINAFETRGIAYNIDVFYRTMDGEVAKLEFIENGYPSDNAIVVSQVIFLYVTDPGFEYAGITNYIPDIDGDNSPLYNILEIRMTVWRM